MKHPQIGRSKFKESALNKRTCHKETENLPERPGAMAHVYNPSYL
jgi:hypothetical protein